MKARVLFSLILLLSVLFAPLWLSLLLVVFGMFYFFMFFEGIVIFLVSDLIFGVAERGYFGIVFSSAVIALVLFVIIEISKKKLKFYPIIKN